MKIYCILVALAILFLFLCSCGGEEIAPTTEESTSSSMSLRLPMPEDIVLMDDPAARLDVDFEPKYRIVYLEGLPGPIGFLHEEPEYELPVHDMENDVMQMANYLKYNNIKKENFIAAVQQMYEMYLDSGCDITEEEYELPNADIIYTFDNEVINAYYRRENPVAPDWSKVKTYESYAEYQKAKG